MKYGPHARILLRYLSGLTFGGAPLISEFLATDPEVVMLTATAIGACVEAFYAFAKKRGWAT